jgi:poly-gamma-glutamate synthesis protein (capsule biosynthesis protein)
MNLPTLRLPLIAISLGLFAVESGHRPTLTLPGADQPPAAVQTMDGDQPVAEDTIRLAIVGDLMCHASQFNEARNATGYDFQPAFEAIRPYLTAADLAIGNLETVTAGAGAGAGFTGYPAFNTPVEYLDALKGSGFDVLTTANNHSLDRHFLGVERTIEALESRGLQHTGSARTQAERDRPLIISVKGLRLGVLAYTYGTNGIPMPAGKPFAVNLIDTLAMARDIGRARGEGADAIAVFLHWGNEYERQPNVTQRRIAAFLARQGVDLVLGSHPHVLQPAEWIGENGRTFVLYSLGNFFSGQRQPFTDSGVILQVSLIRPRDGGPVRIGGTQFVPTYVVRRPRYRIVAVADALQANERGLSSDPSFSPGDAARLRSVWTETTTHLTNRGRGFTALTEPPSAR